MQPSLANAGVFCISVRDVRLCPWAGCPVSMKRAKSVSRSLTACVARRTVVYSPRSAKKKAEIDLDSACLQTMFYNMVCSSMDLAMSPVCCAMQTHGPHTVTGWPPAFTPFFSALYFSQFHLLPKSLENCIKSMRKVNLSHGTQLLKNKQKKTFY